MKSDLSDSVIVASSTQQDRDPGRRRRSYMKQHIGTFERNATELIEDVFEQSEEDASANKVISIDNSVNRRSGKCKHSVLDDDNTCASCQANNLTSG